MNVNVQVFVFVFLVDSRLKENIEKKTNIAYFFVLSDYSSLKWDIFVLFSCFFFYCSSVEKTNKKCLCTISECLLGLYFYVRRDEQKKKKSYVLVFTQWFISAPILLYLKQNYFRQRHSPIDLSFPLKMFLIEISSLNPPLIWIPLARI